MVRLNSEGGGKRVFGWKAVLSVLVFVVLGFAACILPDSPDAFHPQALLRLPIEVPLTALALLLLPRRLALACAEAAIWLNRSIAGIGHKIDFLRLRRPMPVTHRTRRTEIFRHLQLSQQRRRLIIRRIQGRQRVRTGAVWR